MRGRLWLWGIPVVSVLILIFLFLPGLGQSFFAIDDALLFNQSYLHDPWTWQSLKTLVTPGSSPDYYPLRDLSVWIDWTFSDHLNDDTSAAKIQNLFWLLAIAVLSYQLLVRVSGHVLVSILLSCAWLLHPFHQESLHWISARKDLMSWFFIIAAVLLFVRQFSLDKFSKRESAGILVLFVMSLLSKATFLVLPFAILVWMIWLKKTNNSLYPRMKSSLSIVVSASVISLFFVGVTYWVYADNNNMQMSESASGRMFSVAAALGRNVIGIFFPGVNGVDTDPWGGWYRYNERFILIGIVSLLGYLLFSVYAILLKKPILLLFCLLIASVLALTPGFNPLHRSYYSVRYFEPVYFIVLMGAGLALLRTSKAVAVSSCILVVCTILSFVDSGSWVRNLGILEKAHAISPLDPAPASMLLTEYYNLETRKMLNAEEAVKYNDLLQSTLKDCIDEPELNGRCLSFYGHVRYFIRRAGLDAVRTREVLKVSFERTIALKKILFPSLAESEIARSVFYYKLNVDGQLDLESLKTYFKSHQNQTDGDARVLNVVYRCLESGPAESQRLFEESLALNLISIDQARQFIAGIELDSLKMQIANCFKPSK